MGARQCASEQTARLPFPDAQRLVIGSGAEAAILVEERDRVHGTQMPVVLLHDFPAPRIPLKKRRHLERHPATH